MSKVKRNRKISCCGAAPNVVTIMLKNPQKLLIQKKNSKCVAFKLCDDGLRKVVIKTQLLRTTKDITKECSLTEVMNNNIAGIEINEDMLVKGSLNSSLCIEDIDLNE